MAVIDQKVRITPSVIDGPLGERDPNPIHKSDAEAQNQGYKGRLVHGVFPIAVAADYVAVYLENHGIPNGWAITKVKVDFKRPLFLDDVLETGVQVIKASSYDITSLNQDGKKIIEGKIEVGSPSHPPPETLARPWDPAAYLTDAASGVYYWLDLVRLGNPFNGAKQKIVAAGDYHKKYFDINPGETAHDSRLVTPNGQGMRLILPLIYLSSVLGNDFPGHRTILKRVESNFYASNFEGIHCMLATAHHIQPFNGQKDQVNVNATMFGFGLFPAVKFTAKAEVLVPRSSVTSR